MNVLITGGAGFIGSHLADAWIARAARVTVLDDLSTGAIANVQHLEGTEGFACWIDSVMNKPLLAELIDAADVVYHLAAAVGVKLIVSHPVRTIETNVKGTETVLELAAKKKKTVILASTSEVYGKSNKIPFREEDDLVLGATICARWAYACSKALDEFLALAYHKEASLPVVIVRLFNTVGPRQTGRYGMVVPTLVGQALREDPLTVYGDGAQRRCFTHVHDVVRALVELALEPSAIGGVFNIGSTEEITILELAQKIRSLVGSSSPIAFIPYDEAYETGFEDMERRVPCTDRIRSLIGFAPQVGIDDIIRDVAGTMRETNGDARKAEAYQRG